MLFADFLYFGTGEIRDVPHFFEVLIDRMNPEKNLRAVGWSEVGAEISFPS